jgi:hypothetical protein
MDVLQGLGPGSGVVTKHAAHRGGHGRHALLFYSAHRHAKVLGLDDDDRTAGLQFFLHRFDDLRRAKPSTMRANFDNPVMRPSAAGR